MYLLAQILRFNLEFICDEIGAEIGFAKIGACTCGCPPDRKLRCAFAALFKSKLCTSKSSTSESVSAVGILSRGLLPTTESSDPLEDKPFEVDCCRVFLRPVVNRLSTALPELLSADDSSEDQLSSVETDLARFATHRVLFRAMF